MKKLMFAIAAAAAGTVLADVTSANVVGYTNVEIPAQEYTMLGVQFEAVNGEGIDIQDLISNPLEKLPGAANPNVMVNGAQLWYWDTRENKNYVVLYLCNKAGDNYGKWCTGTTLPNDTSWGTAKNKPSTKKLTSGMGLWLIRPAGTYAEPITLTMAGGVVKAQTGREYTIKPGYNMIAGGFTTGFAPNPDTAGVGTAINWIDDMKLLGAANPNVMVNADQIWFWDPNESKNYVMLYLCNKAGDNYQKWCTGTTIPNDSSWGTAKNKPSPKVIPMGRGFWIVHPDSADPVTFTLPQPYSL